MNNYYLEFMIYSDLRFGETFLKAFYLISKLSQSNLFNKSFKATIDSTSAVSKYVYYFKVNLLYKIPNSPITAAI